MTRAFEDKPAVRERVPLWLGLAGPSGGGKTYSALRLATGIQRVFPGEIHVIDTEARRALHYADRFKFQHTEFKAPFSPLDYLAAIQHCVAKKPSVIVIDSCSHEHEGQGGVLEWHDAELERMGGSQANSFRAWAEPKAARRRLVNSMLQMQVNFILCFRAQEKAKPEKGSKELRDLGWMPIAGEQWTFECTAMALLPPGADGIPTWVPERVGERRMVKLPQQFREIFAKSQPLSEDIGEQLAKWAAGSTAGAAKPERQEHGNVRIVTDLIDGYDECVSEQVFGDLEVQRAAIWASTSKGEKERLKAAKDKCQAKLAEGAAA